MRRIGKFWSLSARDQLLLCEAAILLLVLQFCIRFVSFERIHALLNRRFGNVGTKECPSFPQVRHHVERAVWRAARSLPWQSSCLIASIAEFVMLRRRGIPAILVAGVKILSDSSLWAHAWVCPGAQDVGQASISRDFVVVLRIGTQC